MLATFGQPIKYGDMFSGYYFTVPGARDIYYKGHPDTPVSKQNPLDGLSYQDRVFGSDEIVIPIETGTGIHPRDWAEQHLWHS